MSIYNTSACLLFKMCTKSHAACHNDHHINFIVEKPGSGNHNTALNLYNALQAAHIHVTSNSRINPGGRWSGCGPRGGMEGQVRGVEPELETDADQGARAKPAEQVARVELKGLKTTTVASAELKQRTPRGWKRPLWSSQRHPRRPP